MGATPLQATDQCRGPSREARGDRASRAGQRGGGRAPPAERTDTRTSGTQRRGDRTTCPHDHISRGEIPEKAGRSTGLARAGAGAALDERGHGEALGAQGGADGQKTSQV